MDKYEKSGKLLERALKVIPGGTGTFSKSITHYPVGASPLYLVRGHGATVWDVDGNEYTDFVSGLTAVILGYEDPDVRDAVLYTEPIFSLPHPLEIEVAEILCKMIPCAEMVRFGKNGSDATSAAVRVARAYTGRDHVACCGYHGWQDWNIGVTARNLGVPSAVKSLIHPFDYNDLDDLHRVFKVFPEQVACVIMEPMNREYPKFEYLNEVEELCKKNHALFILDEMITGFRFANGGAQELFHVKPDLACFGKAIANGYPLSAVVGSAEVMRWFEKIHCSFTYGGECVSLAAAKATLTKIQREPVVEKIFHLGVHLKNQMNGMGRSLLLTGHPAWTHLNFGEFKDSEAKKKIIGQLIKMGFLMIGTHNLTYAHSKEDIDRLVNTYKEILPSLEQLEVEGTWQNEEFRIR